MKPSVFFSTVSVCIAFIGVALACFSTPQEQIVSDAELVKRTKTIVLARVEKAELLGEDSISVRYHFRKIKNLKGDAPERFTIDGISSVYGDSLDDFDGHRKEVFWENGGGRSWHDTDCVIYPSFAVGGTFLIFLEKPYHRKSFELILRSHDADEELRDKWLSWVETHTKAQVEK